jgi:hypothetical protein
VSDAIKRNLVGDMRVSPRDYELDHIVRLDLGGAPLDLRNMMLQPRAGTCNAHRKDDLERRLSIMVCAGDLTLKGAEHEIATDWRAAYKKWINGKGLRGTVTTWEAQMRLKLERGGGARRTGNEYGVFDETTGKCVGTVSFEKVPGPQVYDVQRRAAPSP